MSFTRQHLFFDDVEVGQEWESLGRTVTETDIVNFAGLSAATSTRSTWTTSSPRRRRSASRSPTACSSSRSAAAWACTSPPMRTLAFLSIREWHFRDPVFIGDTIRVRSQGRWRRKYAARGRRGVITWQRQIVNQDGKVVQEGITVTLVEGRGGRRRDEAGAATPAALTTPRSRLAIPCSTGHASPRP